MSEWCRAAEQKLQALALNRTRQERARDAAREAHVIEATRLSTEGSDNMHAGQVRNCYTALCVIYLIMTIDQDY